MLYSYIIKNVVMICVSVLLVFCYWLLVPFSFRFSWCWSPVSSLLHISFADF